MLDQISAKLVIRGHDVFIFQLLHKHLNKLLYFQTTQGGLLQANLWKNLQKLLSHLLVSQGLKHFEHEAKMMHASLLIYMTNFVKALDKISNDLREYEEHLFLLTFLTLCRFYCYLKSLIFFFRHLKNFVLQILQD